MASTTAPVAPRDVAAGGGESPARVGTAGRRVARRRALPSSRAVVGALLITLAAVGAFALGGRSGADELPSYVVVSKGIAPGARLDETVLTTKPMRLDEAAAAQSYRSI